MLAWERNMSKRTDDELSETSLKRRYVSPTLVARGRLQALTGDDAGTLPLKP